MDAQAHQPGEELADFTENELLSLIEAGTAGAYSEIYRRYIDDAVARASSSLPDVDARRVVDDAFLGVLRSLLNGAADTAEGLRSKVDNAIDERLAVRQPRAGSPLQGSHASDQDQASAQDWRQPDHALLAQALSTLPDNWQRILWLREVEQLSPEAVADRLNIRTAVVERLSNRAHQDLQKEWDRVRPEGSDAAADRRSALVPAFLTSPIVIERLSDIMAQTAPDSTGTPVAARAPESSLQPDAGTAAKGADAAVFADTAADIEPPASAEGAESTEDTEPRQTASLAAVSASADPAHVPAQTSVEASSRSGFSMPKPVLIPVVAACIGLLGTLVGLAIVPHQEEGLRSGVGTSKVSKADTSSEDEESSRGEQSPAGTDSHQASREQGSENSQKSVPGSTDQDENEESSQSSRDDAGRTDDDSPSKDDSGNSGDSGDRPSARNPDDPGPADSDRPGSESPSDPTPPDPTPPDSESPSDEPSEPESPPEPDPTPTTNPEPEPDPTPSDTPPPETEDPASPSDEPPEPTPSDTGTDSAPTPDDPATGTSTASN